MSAPTPITEVRTSIIAKSTGFYIFSEPMSLRQAREIIAPALASLTGLIATVEVVPGAKRGEARVKFSYTLGHARELDARKAWLEGETTKASREGGSYVWTRQTSLDRSVLRAECHNPSTGGRYYVTLRGEGVWACTCPRFATSGKTACKHIQDAKIRRRFETLFGVEGLISTPLTRSLAEVPTSAVAPIHQKGTSDGY